MTSLTVFLNTLQFGLGAKTDFPLHDEFPPIESEGPNLFEPGARQTTGEASVDPDAEPVARVQSGDVDAFGDLMTRHSRRVYRTLVALLGILTKLVTRCRIHS